ncbi:hypothetical protein KAX75_02790 [candidate division WOR-3 bacterium]|nr:hypothetical protein [candidate division WOR-3 bacterium]
MSRSKLLAFITTFLIICSLLFYATSCRKTVTGTETKSSIVFCMLANPFSLVELISDPMPDINSVNATKEWDGNSITFPDKFIASGKVTFYEYTVNTLGTTYTVKVTSNIGNAEGSITLPDSISITQPSYKDTVPIGDVTMSWSSTEGADWYGLYINIHACDSFGYQVNWENLDTLMTTTTLFIPSSHFNVSGAVYYHVTGAIYANAGPPPIPGTSGNMTGTLKGILVGYGDIGFIDFYVGTPTIISGYQQRKRSISTEERMDAYLRKLDIK